MRDCGQVWKPDKEQDRVRGAPFTCRGAARTRECDVWVSGPKKRSSGRKCGQREETVWESDKEQACVWAHPFDWRTDGAKRLDATFGFPDRKRKEGKNRKKKRRTAEKRVQVWKPDKEQTD